MIEYQSRLFRAHTIISLAGDVPEAFVVVGERIVASGSAHEFAQRFLLAEAAERTPSGAWLRARRYDDGKMAEGQVRVQVWP
jgi:hypothetical protein